MALSIYFPYPGRLVSSLSFSLSLSLFLLFFFCLFSLLFFFPLSHCFLSSHGSPSLFFHQLKVKNDQMSTKSRSCPCIFPFYLPPSGCVLFGIPLFSFLQNNLSILRIITDLSGGRAPPDASRPYPGSFFCAGGPETCVYIVYNRPLFSFLFLLPFSFFFRLFPSLFSLFPPLFSLPSG